MMTTRAAVKESLCEALGPAGFDAMLAQAGFCRPAKSLSYRRVISGMSQGLEVAFDVRPAYEPAAIAHLLPYVRLESHNLGQVVHLMTGGDANLVGRGSRSMVFQQQLNNLAPKGRRAVYWYVYDLKQVRDCVAQVREFARTWAIPFLEEYCDIASLARGFEGGDERLPNDRRFCVFVAACHLLLNEPAKAMASLEKRLARPGPRREYARAFEYVGKLLR